MSDAAKWYVVHTYSGYENKVASSIEKAVENRKLHDLIPAVNIPTETVTEVKDGKSREVERKLFPGYVLVKMVMTDETWYLVRNTRGCTGFVGQDKSGGSKPIPLTEEEILAMGVEKREIEVNYAAGDSVRVIDGPLAGFIGVVSSVEPDKNRVNVTVSMFGRETPVELELDQVETLDELKQKPGFCRRGAPPICRTGAETGFVIPPPGGIRASSGPSRADIGRLRTALCRSGRV